MYHVFVGSYVGDRRIHTSCETAPCSLFPTIVSDKLFGLVDASQKGLQWKSQSPSSPLSTGLLCVASVQVVD